MPINIPPLDDRNYVDILRDALARIPVHNPEWTNFNDSDPGVTLIQLFAFMSESILYRANQIPERNRLKFLQLLGIPLVPAAAAQGFVTIMNERGRLVTETLNAGVDVRAGQVRFLTTQGLDVLPISAQLFYKRPIDPSSEQTTLYQQLYADLLGSGLPFTKPRRCPSLPLKEPCPCWIWRQR
jgi:predicted phage baseplate assembly protein